MKVLLVGEFSRLHNSLKEGLLELGHEVSIVGYQDGFKNYPIDFPIEKKWDSGFLKKLKLGIHLLSGFDVSSYLTYRQFKKNKKNFIGFDVVQLINENSFYCSYFYEKKILAYLFKNNSKTYLLSSGYDYLNVKYCFENPKYKSVIQAYLVGRISTKSFENVLKCRTKSFKKLHHYIYSNSSGIIASDLDYHFPLLDNPKYLGLIPNPINTSKINFTPLKIEGRIIIFHGINEANYRKKGNNYFEKALKIIGDQYGDKIEIITTRNVPYATYINSYNKAHILLDQTYSYDQGYNALEAMAKGKVVFTGAEQEFTAHYKLTKTVAVNAVADVDYLVNELSFLIENPDQIIAISQRARTFIEKEHDYIQVAERYIEIWRKN